MKNVDKAYEIAKERYNEMGIDTDDVMMQMRSKKVSIHCWQGDDGLGFEKKDKTVNTGIMATGNFLGRARNGDELREDIQVALSLIPGNHKFNLHSIYAETNGKKVERNELRYEYFENWVEWAQQNNLGLDFNPTIYNHINMKDGYSLSSPDKNIRDFWIEHVNACRQIAFKMGKKLKQKCVNNIWISDGSKDNCINKWELRENLCKSLDEIFSTKYDEKVMKDALEPKLFGIGTESFVVGSLEFYLGYCIKNDKMLCLDAGHYHPTELISEKISSVLMYTKELLLHVSRGVRWDSDHVVTLGDELYAIFNEVKRANAYKKVNIALDFFDASINRVGAWVIGSRNTLKAILFSLLEPTDTLLKLEAEGDYASRLALLEEAKTLPFGAVWDKYCLSEGVPLGGEWIEKMKDYERKVLSRR